MDAAWRTGDLLSAAAGSDDKPGHRLTPVTGD
jgi:hypothetical protein